MLRVLVTLVVLVGGVGLVAELALPAFLESRVEQTVEEHTSGAARVEVDVGDFPVLPGLVRDGIVDRLDVTLREVEGQQITIATVALALEGIEVDRSRLLAGTIEVTAIEAGTASVEVEERAIAEALGAPIDLDPGLLDLAGRALEVVAPDGPAVQLPVPEDLLPCTPEVEVTDRVVRLTCGFEEVPGILLRALEAGR